MENTYHYYAFISYATTDSKWAKWLQHQLSYYHIPTSVKKSKIGIPNKIRPIFIYEYDLAGNQLHQAIEQELSASKYLIVICSPTAAKSKYVNREVETFIKQGRQEYIIPFIVEGEVNASNPDEECFPPALRELMQKDGESELRGANIAINGKRHALVDIVATMLGVRRDLLWDRYKARLMKQRITLAAMVVFAMLCGLFYWDYTRPTYKYFADYVDVWGIPKGIIELDKEQVKQRYGTYRFEYRRVPIGCGNPYSNSNRRVVEVNFINSQGTIIEINQTEHMDRYPKFTIGYDDESGRVKSLIFSQADGKKVVEYELSDEDGVAASIVDIKRVSIGRGTASIRAKTTIQTDDENLNSNAKITRIHYVRDENTGVILGKTYHRNNDRLDESGISDADGVWGELYELDSLGRIAKRTYVDMERERHSLAGGVSSKNYEYNEDGDIVRTECRNINGEFANNDQGWAIGISEVDKATFTNTEYYLNAAGQPCFNIKEGYHKGMLIFDDRYLPIELLFYDIEGNLCRTKKNYASMKVKCDDLGRIVEGSYFDENGKPCYELDLECHKAKFEYVGKSNKQSSVSTYDTNGNLALCKEGFAIMEVKYLDDSGNTEELVSFFDTNKERTLNNNGVSSMLNLYEGGLNTEVRNYGVDGVCKEDSEGCAYYRFKYDDKGNISFVVCYNDIDQFNAQNNQGYAILERKFNDYGNLTFERYYDATATAYSTIRFEYDEVGNATKMIWLNGDETEWIVGSEGWAAIEIDYDVNRNVIERRYYGVDHQPMVYDETVREENVFNSLNQCIESKYYDSRNRLSRIEKNVFDDRGNLIEIDYFDGQGRPYLKNSNATKVVYKYAGYQLIGAEYYRGDELVVGPEGYAKLEIEYNEKNKPVKSLLYDESDRLRSDGYAVVSVEYDDRCNVTRQAYYNSNNELTIGDDGYAAEVSTFDKLGGLCEVYRLNEKEELIPIEGDIARVEKKYDSKGRECSTLYYGTDSKLCLHPDGYAKYIIEYDKYGNITNVAFYGVVNELVDGPYGYAQKTTIYNTNGKLTTDVYRDAIGELVIGPNGYAEYVVDYDTNGNQVNEVFYGTKGELVDSPNGYAKNTTYYNDGKIIEDLYYNAREELVVGPDGYAKVVVTYDSSGEKSSMTFFDADGNDITEQFTN